jgi:hypothetical protein
MPTDPLEALRQGGARRREPISADEAACFGRSVPCLHPFAERISARRLLAVCMDDQMLLCTLIDWERHGGWSSFYADFGAASGPFVTTAPELAFLRGLSRVMMCNLLQRLNSTYPGKRPWPWKDMGGRLGGFGRIPRGPWRYVLPLHTYTASRARDEGAALVTAILAEALAIPPSLCDHGHLAGPARGETRAEAHPTLIITCLNKACTGEEAAGRGGSANGGWSHFLAGLL